MAKYSKGKEPGPGRPPGVKNAKTVALEGFAKMLSYEDGKGKSFFDAYLNNFMQEALKGGWSAKILAEKLFKDDILDDIDRMLNKHVREDQDFLHYRIHRLAHDVQQQFLLSKYKRIYEMAGRRAGKTEGNILKVTDTVAPKDTRILIICLTFEGALRLYYQPILDRLQEVGLEIQEKRRSDGFIKCNGAEIHFSGNSTADEREKKRGYKWDLVIIDEVQSQKALPYLIEDIISPCLVDRGGTLVLSGTGPRIRGTYWEHLWVNDTKALRLNWNMTQNPHIPDHENVLKNIREEKGLKETDPLYIREYLGQICYDDDALVYRLGDTNVLHWEAFEQWLNTQPITDVKFTAGLDYGWEDSDGFAIVCYSESKPERWIVYEYKKNRSGVSELVQAIRAGMDFISNGEQFKRIPNKFFYIYADTSDKKISYELYNLYNIPVVDAYKAEKKMAIELLQEEVRTGAVKVMKDGIFWDESLKTVFKRNERDELTREIDDDAYHPDFLDAVLYALRPVWDYSTSSRKK